MARTPEGRVKAQVKEVLAKVGAHFFMPVQTGYGMPHLDFIVCFRGRYVAIETKAKGKSLTPRQEQTKTNIESNLGVVFVIDETNIQTLEPLLLSLS